MVHSYAILKIAGANTCNTERTSHLLLSEKNVYVLISLCEQNMLACSYM